MFGFHRRAKPLDRNFQKDNYLVLQVGFLKLLGMWPINFENYLPDSLHWLGQSMKGLYVLLLNLNLLHMAMSLVKSAIDVMGHSVDEVSAVMQSFIIYVAGFCMCLYFQVRLRDNKRMVAFVNAHLMHRSAPGLSYVTTEPCYRWARTVSIWWNVLCVVGTFHYSMYPILMWKRILPINSWYPFDVTVSPTFEFIYVCQMIAHVQIGFLYAVYGAMYASIIILMCGQYDIIFCSLKNILYTALIADRDRRAMDYVKGLQRQRNNVSAQELDEYFHSTEFVEDLDEYPVFSDGNAKTRNPIDADQLKGKYDDKISIELRPYIIQHQTMRQVRDLIEDFFHPFLLGKLFVSTMLVCLFGYTASIGLDTTMKIVNIVEYLSLVLFELMVVTYFPSMLMIQSNKMPDAIRRSPWLVCGPRVRKTFLIMMINSVSPLKLTAGKFYNLNFPFYASTLKASFSYYTLLKNLRIREITHQI